MSKLSLNFVRSEFECGCGCGFDVVDAELIKLLENIRFHFNAIVNVSSGARCEAYNESVGGSKNSQHLLGKAADITLVGVAPDSVAEYVAFSHPNTYGLGRYNTFTHVDVRDNKARWGKR